MKYRILQFARKIIGKFGFQLISDKQIEHFRIYTEGLLDATSKGVPENSQINSVVFSKDRAMQLHAFLTSYMQQVTNRGRMHVLYKCSDDRHRKSYQELSRMFPPTEVVFIEELNFRQQLIQLCEHSPEEKIILFVDDMIFTHHLDYHLLRQIDPSKYILTLSRGKDMDYSIVLQKAIKLPTFTKTQNGLLCFRWDENREYSDWTFPLGVSGYMYSKSEFVAMMKATSFKAPNSLEDSLQTFLPFFKNRFGLCTEYAACVCVHANLVQTESINPVLGAFSIEDLLKRWEDGQRINLHEFYNKPMNITQVQDYSFN